MNKKKVSERRNSKSRIEYGVGSNLRLDRGDKKEIFGKNFKFLTLKFQNFACLFSALVCFVKFENVFHFGMNSLFQPRKAGLTLSRLLDRLRD